MFEGVDGYKILSSISNAFVDLLNSQFGAAMAGAFFGAFAAYLLAEKKEKRSQSVNRLQAGNAAAAEATSILISGLGFKEQLAGPLVSKYLSDRERFLAQRTSVESPEPIAVEYDLRTVHPFSHDAQRLSELLVSGVAPTKRVYLAASTLRKTLNSLEIAIEARNKEVLRLRGLKPEVSEAEFAGMYFCVKNARGDLDTRLLDSIVTIKEQLDSSVFFSKLITESVSKQNTQIGKKLGSSSPKALDFEINEENVGHLLPDPSEFPDWTS